MTSPRPHSRERIAVAFERFAAFFDEIRERFVEREELLTQIALALLAREHVLVTGPPGTGKSAVAAATLGRIVHEETGEPSLFAKQFTESTVQTELIGPVDFRTLTESGRREHFTDEGMLGAVHAFLDEVLDGRDMLLRSTLNILEERELKQGTKITRGEIECAVMTSNRYLAEVLEESRVTLLAFVDRIAFVGFVPRGFAHPDRLDDLVAATLDRGDELVRRLTVEDVDVLQDLTETVRVPRPVLEAAIELGRRFDERTTQLERADPTFSATRYFSTRAYIRLAKLLRVIVVYDRAFRQPERPLVATADDLGLLRLTLMLAGPKPADVEALLERENDPRERRQLELMRSELEIFRECLRELEVREVEEASAPEPPPKETDAQAPAPEASAPPFAELTDAVLALAAGPGDLEAIEEVARVADRIERRQPRAREATRRARGRALEALADALAFGALGGQDTAPLADGSMAEAWLARFETHLGAIEAAADLRERLQAAGAALSGDTVDERFAAAHARLEADLANLTDVWVHATIPAASNAPASERLAAVTTALGPVMTRMHPFEERVRALSQTDGTGVARRTLAKRLSPLLEASYRGLEAPGRERLVQQVREALAELERLSLTSAVDRTAHLAWTVEALIRGARPPATPESPSLASYRQLRGTDRMPAAFALAELVGLLAQSGGAPWSGELAAVRDAVSQLEASLLERLAAIDLERLDSLATLFEGWAASGEEREALLSVAFEERALLRSSLEAQLVADLVPGTGDRSRAVGDRFRAVADQLLGELAADRAKEVERRWSRRSEG